VIPDASILPFRRRSREITAVRAEELTIPKYCSREQVRKAIDSKLTVIAKLIMLMYIIERT